MKTYYIKGGRVGNPHKLLDLLVGIAIGILFAMGVVLMFAPKVEAKTECESVCVDWKWELQCKHWHWGHCTRWEWEKVCKDWECKIEPTPTPITEYKDVGYGVGGSPTFPHDTKVYTNECVGENPKTPLFSATRISPTAVKLNWWPIENVRKYAVIYGYKTENEMGADNIPNNATEFIIDKLEEDKYINIRMLAEGNNFCPAWSEILDP